MGLPVITIKSVMLELKLDHAGSGLFWLLGMREVGKRLLILSSQIHIRLGHWAIETVTL
jgi:hypothetical protein